jgi:ERF superfamily
MKSIYASFVKAQHSFAPALKTSTNPHFKSRYADLAACVEAVIDALNNNGIGLVQKTHTDDTGVTVETVFIHESGESFSGGVLHVPAAKQDPQGYGSALSYARRYSLMAACGIAPEDDDGNAASKPRRAAQATPTPPSETAAPRLVDFTEARKAELDELSLYMIDCATNDTHMPAIKVWHDPATWAADAGAKNDEQLYVWGNLKPHSALRSAIKANKPA